MFFCNDCQFSSGLDDYCKHITLWHQKFNYICGQNNCKNVYSNIQTLKRHLKSNHPTALSTNCYDDRLEVPSEPIETSTVPSKSNKIPTFANVSEKCDQNLNTSEIFESHSISDIVQKYRVYILSLYSDPSLDRKKAHSIATNCSDIIIELLLTLQHQVNSIVNIDNKADVSRIFESTKEKFNVSLSERKVKSFLRNNGYYKDPVKFTIDEGVADTLQHRRLILANKKSTAVQMDIEFIFKSFFELPNMLQACTDYMKKLEGNDQLTNFIQGESWLERKKNLSSKTVIPFFLYHDDFEPGNSLGAKSGIQSMCSFFVFFPTLPPHIATSLENILPILSCLTSQKKYGLDKILHLTLQSFKLLEETGIVLNIDGENIRVHFELCLLIGDNKALNELAGMTLCFVKDGFCRICYCTVEESKCMISENKEKLRTVKEYDKDIVLNNFITSGVREECVFNELLNFHIISCPSVDIMHDVFEGVCHFQMTKIVSHFLKENFFSLDDLNNRKALFDFGLYEIGNISVDIQLNHLKKQKLKMTASQSLCFTIYFSIIIGDLIPRNDEVWDFYITFLRLLDLLMQNSFVPSDIELIAELVTKNNQSYIALFGATLKPKQHFMLHYPQIIKKMGPLKKLYAMKQEMYHKHIKRYVNQTFNRRNLPVSVCIKESLKFGSRLFERKGYSHNFYSDIGYFDNINVKTADFIFQIQNLLPNISEISFIKHLKYKQITYEPNCVVFCLNNFNEIELYKIIYILEDVNHSITMFTHKLLIVSFDIHYQCYLIENHTNVCKILSFESLQYFPRSIHVLPTGELAVRPQEKI